MARSPLTLAASVTSALPRAGVVSVAALSENAAGRYDSALATLDDGRQVVVRVPTDADADRDLRGEARALQALTAGVRAVLPLAAPVILGDTVLDARPVVVHSWLPGYRVDAGHVPPGPGVATELAAAIAAVHALPTSVVRDGGLPALDAAQVRAEAERLLDRAEATGALPFGLLRRWSAAVAADELWRFETTVVLGGVDPASFLFEDDADDVPRITGLLQWGGLSVGDPAVDLRWLASAPDARTDVLDAYAVSSPRAVDGALSERARLHAELEFASWLVHGHAAGSESVVADAVALLEALDESVRDAPPLAQDSVTVDDAFAAIGRVPQAAAVDTSMQTDTYDADALSEYTADDTGSSAPSEDETAPLELSDWVRPEPAGDATAAHADDDDPEAAARNALRRWTETA
ncbi:MAG: phosphotransferase [Candidatus Microbacterium phytovorans]|uniref:Phosphotransferase n=1 Tax=Candidatus Microbacterium phytovorans TaxID=3121374 RepID=A0AAJ5W3T1_9MICO|nr:phosphotransferase [Microbacterium sp.]WEK14678.1 MAG: phosphotransferase [Microbacterium sp.]